MEDKSLVNSTEAGKAQNVLVVNSGERTISSLNLSLGDGEKLALPVIIAQKAGQSDSIKP